MDHCGETVGILMERKEMGIEMVQWGHRDGTVKHCDRAVVHCDQKSNCDRKWSVVEGLWGHCDRIVNTVMEQ